MKLQAGFSLAELMAALAIATIVLGGLVAVHERSRHFAAQAESIAELADVGRFALSYVATDLRHAGFYGLASSAHGIDGVVDTEAPISIPVAGDCGRNWSISLQRPVEGQNNHYELDCPAYRGAARPGSDVLVIRRAADRISLPEVGRLQLHSGLARASLNATGSVPDIAPVETRDLVVSAYYVSTVSSGGKGIPSLRRKVLLSGPRIVDEEIIPGIEDLQIQFAIASEPAQEPGRNPTISWVNPDSTLLPSSGSDRSSRVVAVRLWLLVSGRDAPRAYHASIGAYADRPAPPSDSRRRQLIAQTFAFRNGDSE
jgi:type IV pilus assembly protein PilW